MYETHVLQSCNDNAPLSFILIINHFLSSKPVHSKLHFYLGPNSQSRLNANLFKSGASASQKANKDMDANKDDEDGALKIALTQSLETHSQSRGQDIYQLTLDDEEQERGNFGGNNVQIITDPWLSGDNIHQDRSSRLTRPRQPIALLSTATSRDNSPSTSSPQRYVPEQVSSSDHDESCSELTIVRGSRTRRPRSSPSRKSANVCLEK